MVSSGFIVKVPWAAIMMGQGRHNQVRMHQLHKFARYLSVAINPPIPHVALVQIISNDRDRVAEKYLSDLNIGFQI